MVGNVDEKILQKEIVIRTDIMISYDEQACYINGEKIASIDGQTPCDGKKNC